MSDRTSSCNHIVSSQGVTSYSRNTDLIHPVGHPIEDHPGSSGGADHDVLALRSVSVVDVGPEHIGDTGPLGPPHGQLQGELGRGLTGGRRGRPPWPAPAQSLDQLIQVRLELGSFPSGDVVKVVLGQETVAEKSETDGKKSVSQKVVAFKSLPLRSECQHDVFLVRGEFEPEHPGTPHHVARDDDAAAAASGRHHDQALVDIPVDVLGVAHPGAVPCFRAKIIVEDFLEVEWCFKIIS